METPVRPTPRRWWMKTPAYREAEKHYRLALNGDRPTAWQHVCRALELDPEHASASVHAGDLWLYEFDEIGYADHSPRSAAAVALGYFDCALEIEPLHADAWAGKAHALCRLDRHEEALAATQSGLAALPCGVDYLWHPAVSPYVDRELRAGMVKALLGLGRRDDARRVLDEALSAYPGHYYLEGLDAELGETC